MPSATGDWALRAGETIGAPRARSPALRSDLITRSGSSRHRRRSRAAERGRCQHQPARARSDDPLPQPTRATAPGRTRRRTGWRWQALTVLAASFALGLVAVATPSGAGGRGPGFALSTLDDGSPAAWAPCRTVSWAVNPAGAPPGGLADVERAVRLTAQATGLVLVPAGTTSSVPQQSWLHQGGWPAGTADLVVAWAVPARDGVALPAESDLLTGSAGVGGWAAEHVPTPAGPAGRITRGYVVLDAGDDADFVAGFAPERGLLGTRPPRGRLLLHELGHAVGLAHVDDDRQVMNPRVQAADGAWEEGDLAGLQALRRGQHCPRHRAHRPADVGDAATVSGQRARGRSSGPVTIAARPVTTST
jgi:hypothetical protein